VLDADSHPPDFNPSKTAERHFELPRSRRTQRFVPKIC
jgi:hypothetical protein